MAVWTIPTTTLATREDAPGRRQRDPWLDNARWLAASLVVTFHVLQLHLQPGTFAEWFWGATWVFRLPLFALLAGVFSPASPNLNQRRALIRSVLFPLIGVAALHLALDWWFTGEWTLDPATPAYTIWFLYGLIVWRLILPYLSLVRWPLLWVSSVALIVGLPAGFQNAWALSAVMAHLPFFVLGWQLKDHLWRIRNASPAMIAAAIVVLAAIVSAVTVTFLTGAYRTLPQGLGDPYLHDRWAALPEIALRVAVLACGALGALSVLTLTPRRYLPVISAVGSHGFIIYLLHGLVVRLMREFGLLPVAGTDQLQVPWLVAFSVGLALLLGSTPVHRAMGWLVRPRLGWLLGASTTEPEAVRRVG